MPKSRLIKSDGKIYRFTPGEGGSLFEAKKKEPTGFDLSIDKRAKTVGPKKKFKKVGKTYRLED